MSLIEINDDDFEAKVLQADKPVVVCFYADWDPTHRRFMPKLDTLAMEQRDIVFAKVNMDRNPRSVSQYGINAIPTTLMFKDGRQVKELVGAVTDSVLRGAVANLR